MWNLPSVEAFQLGIVLLKVLTLLGVLIDKFVRGVHRVVVQLDSMIRKRSNFLRRQLFRLVRKGCVIVPDVVWNARVESLDANQASSVFQVTVFMMRLLKRLERGKQTKVFELRLPCALSFLFIIHGEHDRHIRLISLMSRNVLVRLLIDNHAHAVMTTHITQPRECGIVQRRVIRGHVVKKQADVLFAPFFKLIAHLFVFFGLRLGFMRPFHRPPQVFQKVNLFFANAK